MVRRDILFILSLLLGAQLLVNCAGTGTLTVNGTPDAEIYLITDEGVRTKIGKTPRRIGLTRLFVDGNDVAQIEIQKKGFYMQRVLIPRQIVSVEHTITANLAEIPPREDPTNTKDFDGAIAKNTKAINGEIARNAKEIGGALNNLAENILKKAGEVANVKVENSMKGNECARVGKESLDKLGKGVAIVQARILSRDFEVASIKVATLLTEFSNVSVLFDLQGNILYLQKNYRGALEAYQRSLELDPGNVETANMVKRLKEISGVSSAH